VDFIIVALPVPMVVRLHMLTERKVAVLSVFALGAVAVAASIIRLIIFYHAKEVAFQPGQDNDLLLTQILFWSFIESALALIACCLPLVHSVFLKSSIESAVRSIRSLASLRSSNGSAGSRVRRPQNAPRTGRYERNNSTESHAQIVPDYLEPSTVESYAMKDLSNPSHKNSAGGITVTNTIDTSSVNGNSV